MKLTETSIPGLLLLEPKLYRDDRGWFAEMFNQQTYSQHGIPTNFVQDNQSHSLRGVLRGLHYQLGQPQGKLVRVLAGTIYDVAVDLRPGSPTRGRWAAFELSAEKNTMLWIPENFAHGFLVTSATADVLYKVTRPYDPAAERTLLWNDPTVNVEWPQGFTPVLSPKDAAGSAWESAELP